MNQLVHRSPVWEPPRPIGSRWHRMTDSVRFLASVAGFVGGSRTQFLGTVTDSAAVADSGTVAHMGTVAHSDMVSVGHGLVRSGDPRYAQRPHCPVRLVGG